MNPELHQKLNTVTPLSKYLAMALFIIMPFVGLYVGYQFAPEKVVEVSVEHVAKTVLPKNEIISQLSSTEHHWIDEKLILNEFNEKYAFGVIVSDKGGEIWPGIVVKLHDNMDVYQGALLIKDAQVFVAEFEWLNSTSFRFKQFVQCWDESVNINNEDHAIENHIHFSDPRCRDVSREMIQPRFISEEWVYGSTLNLFE